MTDTWKRVVSSVDDEHCIHGHLWSANEVWRIRGSGPRKGEQYRFCRACRRDADERRAQRRRDGSKLVKDRCRRGHDLTKFEYIPRRGCLICKHDKKLREKFGLTWEDYERILSLQRGSCAICRTDTPAPDNFFHVDHDHSSGRVRGLLCPKCNRGIGHFDDEPERLEAAAQYLKKDQGHGVINGRGNYYQRKESSCS